MPRYDAHERGFSRYARITRFVRDTLRDGAVRDPRARDDHRRPRGGERAQQPRNGACPRRTGVRGVPGGGAGHAQLRRLARCLRPAPDHAAQTRLDADERTTTTSCTRPRSARPAPWPSSATTAAPVLAFPSEGGRAYDWRDNGMIGARRGACSTAGRIKLYCVDSFDAVVVVEPVAPARGARARARALRVVDPRPGRAVHPARHRRRDHHHRAQPRRLPRRQLRAQARRPVPARDLHVGQLRPVDLERLGRARRATYFNNPIDYVGHLDGDHLDWLRVAAEPAAGLRPGAVGGHDRLAASPPSGSPGCSPRRGSATSSTCGATTSPTTGTSWRAQIAHHLPRFC